MVSCQTDDGIFLFKIKPPFDVILLTSPQEGKHSKLILDVDLGMLWLMSGPVFTRTYYHDVNSILLFKAMFVPAKGNYC